MFLFGKRYFNIFLFFLFFYKADFVTCTYGKTTPIQDVINTTCTFFDVVSLYKIDNNKLMFTLSARVSLFYKFYNNSDFLNFGVGGSLKWLSFLKRCFSHFIFNQQNVTYLVPCGFLSFHFLVFDFYYCTVFWLSLDIIDIVQFLRLVKEKNEPNKNAPNKNESIILCVDVCKSRRNFIHDLVIPKFVLNIQALLESLFESL